MAGVSVVELDAAANAAALLIFPAEAMCMWRFLSSLVDGGAMELLPGDFVVVPVELDAAAILILPDEAVCMPLTSLVDGGASGMLSDLRAAGLVEPGAAAVLKFPDDVVFMPQLPYMALGGCVSWTGEIVCLEVDACFGGS